MERRSNTDTLGLQAHHTSHTLSVQPHKQRLLSCWKMLAHVIHKMLHAIRHAQRHQQPLMIGKGYRDTSFVHVQSGKDIVVLGIAVPPSSKSLLCAMDLCAIVQEHSLRSSTSSYTQGERISSRILDRAIPFVVRFSNHERYCDTVFLGEG